MTKIEKLIQKEALKYERYKDQLDSIPVEEVEQFRNEVTDAYQRLVFSLPAGFFWFEDFDPYENLEQMTFDAIRGHMKISMLNNNSKLLPGTWNLQFRAIHDYFHYILQQPFDFKGEYNVYKATKFLHASRIGKRILYSEIVIQAAFCTYFGSFGPQKVII